ncbi:helix-turn-helix domain-containing protein [Mesorhizobium sp. M0924]|uniref:helix-turn-helix domain-containing protein n=1 Tax=unclassified Mesorhizobium TaxID=325217 RepID=UPI003339C6D4
MLDRIRSTLDVQPVGDLFPAASSRAVKRALLLMESNLQETLSVAEIAGRLHLSRRQLERLFGAELGIGPMAAYLALRVHQAKSLLEGSDLAIGDIAYRCGFPNAGHFSRVFRHQTGITPTHLRHPNRMSGVFADGKGSGP